MTEDRPPGHIHIVRLVIEKPSATFGAYLKSEPLAPGDKLRFLDDTDSVILEIEVTPTGLSYEDV